jgi:hypothetical protein
VVRALVLWVLRVPDMVSWWRRRRPRRRPVSLSKERRGGRWAAWESWSDWDEWEDAHDLGFRGDDIWTKLRTGAVWLLVAFSSGALFVALMSTPDWDDRVEALREAGAEVGVAKIVTEPGGVRADVDDDDVVQGYSSRLVVSVPGGPERLAVNGAYTSEKPRKGTEVDVLWARSAPRLGGYVNETQDLSTIAAGRWEAFPDSELGGVQLIAFILLVAVFGGVLTPIFTLVADADDLQELAWSPLAQTVRAALTAAVFLGWRPLLLGEQPQTVEALFAGGGFVLVFLVYVFSSIRSLA